MRSFKEGDKVKVIKASRPSFWYADKIGSVFTLRKPISSDNWAWAIEDDHNSFLKTSDIELVEEDLPLVLEEHPLESYPNKDEWDGVKVQGRAGIVYTILKSGKSPDQYKLEYLYNGIKQRVFGYTDGVIQKYINEGSWTILEDVVKGDKKEDDYSLSHYDNYYTLTEEDIEAGQIKVDAYWVAKQWKTGSRDDSGALWHFEPRNKYDREIVPFMYCDVYDVLRAFNVKDQALAHLIKKALAVGQRGHKDSEEDYKDILDSAKRALDQFLVWKEADGRR